MAVQISGNDITVPRDTTVTRNLTVGGVLTYEDVTNVDSVGLVTARSGIEIGARPGVAASISVDGNMIVSGISTFGGASAIAGNVTVGSGITLSPDGDIFATGISTFKDGVTITSGSLNILNGSSADGLNVTSANNTLGILSSTDSGANLDLFDDDTQTRIRTVDGSLHLYSDFKNEVSSSAIRFFVDGSNEKLRIDSNGRLLIGHTTTPNSVASLAVVGSYGGSSNNTPFVYLCRDEAATAISGGESLGQILFASNDGYRGAVVEGVAEGAWSESSSDGYLVFKTTPDNTTVPSQRLRITGSGQIEFRNINTAADTGAVSQVNWIGPYVYQHSKTVTATTNGSGVVAFDLGCPFYYDGTTFEYFINASPTDNTNFTTTYQKGFFTKARGGGLGQFEVIKNDSAKAGCSLGTPTAGNPNGHQFNITISGAVANKEYRATILYTGISRYAGYT